MGSSMRGMRGIVAAVAVGALVAGPATVSAAVRPITEFPIVTPKSGPVDMVYGPDGNVWFVDQTSNKIGMVTHTGTINGYVIPTANSQPTSITAGRDGNLWFTESGANKIGRITPGGVFTQFSLAAGSGPRGITSGPDGNLWFTDFTSNKIGRITTTGTVTTFSVPVASSGPARITAGGDGNLWFTMSSVGQIGRVTPTGTFSHFSLGSTSAAPARITAGPDGALWFTEQGSNTIGRITTAGVVTHFPIPTAKAHLVGITAGADGNLWFTEQATNHIGRITTGGVVSEYTPPTAASQPTGITLGADGNIWFTEFAGNKVGYVSDFGSHTTYVIVHDGFDGPNTRVVPMGTSTKWVFEGPNQHTATESSPLALFDSGPVGPVGFFSQLFNAAGTYPYTSTGDPFGGTIKVPMVVPATSTGSTTPFNVTWAAAAATGSQTFDVEVELPNTTTFVPWQTGVTAASAMYTPSGTGKYTFHARLNSGTNHGDWSSLARVTVS
jgi:virginiamycin B lyase